jgi:hypothetical protein
MTPLNNSFNFAQRIGQIYSFGHTSLSCGYKEAATNLMRVGFDGLRHRTPPPVVGDADP